MWPCVVTYFSITKPTTCTNFTNLFWHECFGQFVCPSSGVYSLYTQQCFMSNRFIDSFRAGPGWNPRLNAVYKLVWHTTLLSVQWINSWWRTDELSETCRVSRQNKFVKLVPLVGFIIKRITLLTTGNRSDRLERRRSTVVWHSKENKHWFNFRKMWSRVLRRIFGPTRDEITGGWSKLHNGDFNRRHPIVF
jgi:hypothetical protein